MTDTPDKPAPDQTRPKPTRKLKPVPMWRLLIGRPRLPVRSARLLGWLVFIGLAVLPLALAAAAVFYFTSARWPADFSAKLSRQTGLHVTVERTSGLLRNRLVLHNISIAPPPGLPPILTAQNGTYDAGDAPTLTLRQVHLNLDLNWWTDPKALPEPGMFPSNPELGTPALDLSHITITLTDGDTCTLHADTGIASLSNGLLKLKLVTRVEETTPGDIPLKTLTAKELLSATVGYQQGKLVKQLVLKDAPAEMIRSRLALVLGRDWAAAFTKLSGDLVFEHPGEGMNWELDGRGAFDPALLEESAGLAGLGGRYDVKLGSLKGADAELLAGTFEISLVKSPYELPFCSAEALKAIQVIATATEPLLGTGMERLPFDRAGAIITVTPGRVQVQGTAPHNAIVASGTDPILQFPPQMITRVEWRRRVQLVRFLWAQLRVS